MARKLDTRLIINDNSYFSKCECGKCSLMEYIARHLRIGGFVYLIKLITQFLEFNYPCDCIKCSLTYWSYWIVPGKAQKCQGNMCVYCGVYHAYPGFMSRCKFCDKCAWYGNNLHELLTLQKINDYEAALEVDRICLQCYSNYVSLENRKRRSQTLIPFH